ncbi:MAG: Transcriptional regulator IclR, partial [Paenibacillus sp.]|jgi:DNA-binding IclR family transcriptional regulator|nr:Transcriptional regulator IclR [Paenibacillus sp.]
MTKENPYYIVQSVERALMIVDVFIRKNKPLGIPEIAEEVKLHKSVVHRLLATLKAFQMLEQSPETGKYTVGPKAYEFGSIYMNNPLIMEGRRLLPGLSEETGELAHMAILNQGSLLYVVHQGVPKSLLAYVPVGMRNPLNTTGLGKVLLAWKDEAEARQLLQAQGMEKRTEKSITDIDAFMSELNAVKSRGYALDDEETKLGSRCIAFPVRDNTGAVVAGISVSGTTRTIPEEQIEETASIVRNYALAISERLGFNDLNR